MSTGIIYISVISWVYMVVVGSPIKINQLPADKVRELVRKAICTAMRNTKSRFITFTYNAIEKELRAMGFTSGTGVVRSILTGLMAEFGFTLVERKRRSYGYVYRWGVTKERLEELCRDIW